MINFLEVSNFRNISHIELNLNNITVIVGKNDVGKTNILELINILSVPSDLSRVIYLSNRRTTDPVKSLKFLFRNGDFSEKITGRLHISKGTSLTGFNFEYILRLLSNFDSDTPNFEFTGRIARNELLEYRLRSHIVSEQPMFPSLSPGIAVKTSRIELKQSPHPGSPEYISVFIDNTLDAPSKGLEEILSSIIEMGKKEELIEEINRILPFKLKDIMIITSRGVELYIQKEDGVPVPFSLYGAGTRFILKLAAICIHLNSFASDLPKVVLIDEIENGLHYSVKPKVWEFIFSKSNDVQFIITTHDEEFFRAIFEIPEEKTNPEKFTTIRIDRKIENDSETFIPAYYDLELLRYGIDKGWEIRG